MVHASYECCRKASSFDNVRTSSISFEKYIYQHHFLHCHYLNYMTCQGSPCKRERCMSVEMYSDAYYARFLTDQRSISGYCCFMGGNLVTWKCNKQLIESRPNTEAVFRAMDKIFLEIKWHSFIHSAEKNSRYIQRDIQSICSNRS